MGGDQSEIVGLRRLSMRRMHLIEIHEQPWCPPSLRDALTDYLQFAIESGNPYGAIVERLKQSVLRARATRVIDLCSGGGGPWRRLHREFASTNFPIEVCLTDKYPNLAAFRLAQTESGGKLSFCSEPVNAGSVPRSFRHTRANRLVPSQSQRDDTSEEQRQRDDEHQSLLATHNYRSPSIVVETFGGLDSNAMFSSEK